MSPTAVLTRIDVYVRKAIPMTEYLIEFRDPRYAGTILTGIIGETEQEAIQNFMTDNIEPFDEGSDFEIVGIKPVKVL